MTSVLLVENEARLSDQLKPVLPSGWRLADVRNCALAREYVQDLPVDCLLVDMQLPREEIHSLFRDLRESGQECCFIVLCATDQISSAVEAIRAGADDFVIKDVEIGDLPERIERVLGRVQTSCNGRPDLQKTWTPGQMVVGKSKRMLEIMKIARRVAGYPATVLLMGESGTGKELFARWIHRMSDRAADPFVAVNLAAMPSDLVESTLFGHEKGAFTGAVGQRIGKFGLAQDGTLLLDEITELKLELQPKLLRVLQEGEYERVGGDRTRHNRARIIAASNRDMLEEVREGSFRADLFYRLNVVTITLPPLRERCQDIPELADLFVAKYNRLYGRSVQGVSREAIQSLMEHDWPGNIRELENVIQRAVIVAEGDYATEEDLSFFDTPDRYDEEQQAVELSGTLEDIEIRYIEQVLKRTDGHQGRASKILGIDRKTLYNKIMKYGLRRSLETPMSQARG